MSLTREINMPPLSNLSISHQATPVQSPVPQQEQYAPSPVPMPVPMQVPVQVPLSQNPAASIQSWAGETVQQPRPVQPQAQGPPMGGMWNPNMGIKFGTGQAPKPGTWNPSSGIKFG